MTNYDLEKEYIRYNEAVLTGEILASRNIILACQRFKDRFSRDDMYFDYNDVDKRIRFCRKFKQFKERFNKKPLVLLPWQEWIFANIFGFKWTEDNSRVTTKVLLFVARKAGKTALSAALCLVQLFLDDNNGQEIDLIANNTKQAGICFEYVEKFGKSLDPTGLILKPYRDQIKMPITDSAIVIKPNEYRNLDGLNPSTFICDEFAAALNSKSYDVLKSGQGFQTSPLAIIITTAGHLLDGYPLFEMRKGCIRILEGDFEDDSQFSALYELDDDDDWEDTDKWVKSNPALGHTVSLKALMDDFRTAKNIPFEEAEFKAKHLNVFCHDDNGWLDPEFVRDSMQELDIDKLNEVKDYVWGAIDLSSTTDLTCFTFLYPPSKKRNYLSDKYIFRTQIYVTEQGLKNSKNRDLYKNWIANGYLNLIEGNAVDYDRVMYDILDYKDHVRIDSIGYDPWNATQFVINCEKKGLQMQPFSQSISAFTQPTREFERLIFSEKVIIEYNPIIPWAFNNVVIIHPKATDNIKPGKLLDENKIDPVITIVQSLGTYLYTTGQLNGDTEIYTGKKNGDNKQK